MDLPHPMAAYRAEFPWPPMDPLAFECVGRYGYGNGRVLSGNMNGPHGGPTVPGPGGMAMRPIEGGCAACDLHQECWLATVDTARELMPTLMELHDEISAAGYLGAEFLNEWQRRTGQEVGDSKSMIPPPPMLLSVENLTHGTWHTIGERFVGQRPGQDRG